MIYDTDINITWLQNANYAATELSDTRVAAIIPEVGSVAGHTLTSADFKLPEDGLLKIGSLPFTLTQVPGCTNGDCPPPPGCTNGDCPSPVPEPSTFLLITSGLAGLGGVAWRRHRRGWPRAWYSRAAVNRSGAFIAHPRSPHWWDPWVCGADYRPAPRATASEHPPCGF